MLVLAEISDKLTPLWLVVLMAIAFGAVLAGIGRLLRRTTFLPAAGGVVAVLGMVSTWNEMTRGAFGAAVRQEIGVSGIVAHVVAWGGTLILVSAGWPWFARPIRAAMQWIDTRSVYR